MAMKLTTHVDENGRICTKCKIYKPWFEFSPDKRATTEHATRCLKCARRSKTCKESKRNSTYGMHFGQFDNMFNAQNGKCKICKCALLKTGQCNNSAAIDHCHITGKIRGLLCNNCNSGLGKFRDKPELLEIAAAYLRTNS